MPQKSSQSQKSSESILTSYSQAQNNTSQNPGTAVPAMPTSGTPSASAVAQSANPAGASKGDASSLLTVIGVFASQEKAEKAVLQLRQQGFSQEEINVISKESSSLEKNGEEGTEYYDDDVTDGAITGGTIGGIGGLILGAGAMAIPGIGPVIAAGPIAAALSGVVTGGLAGGLIDWGIPSEASQRYESDVAEGRILTIVKTVSSKVDQAAKILRQNDASDVETHPS